MQRVPSAHWLLRVVNVTKAPFTRLSKENLKKRTDLLKQIISIVTGVSAEQYIKFAASPAGGYMGDICHSIGDDNRRAVC